MEKSNIVILVTGASSGIGQAIAEKLAGNPKYTVYGTSRKEMPDRVVDDRTIHMIEMDVTDENSITNAMELLITKEKRIDVLINCAGFGISGAIESVPVEIAQKQFDVNFFGTVRVIQKTLPYMRSQKEGTIINIGSVAGYIPIPFQSMYSSAKFALESLTESLKMELSSFNINVCLVEPGDTRTNFTKSRLKAGKEEIEAFYYPANERAISIMEEDEMNGYSPDKTAQVVDKILRMEKPPLRVTVGFGYKVIYFLMKILPAGLKHYIIKKKYIG